MPLHWQSEHCVGVPVLFPVGSPKKPLSHISHRRPTWPIGQSRHSTLVFGRSRQVWVNCPGLLVSGQGHGRQGVPLAGSPNAPSIHRSQLTPVVSALQLVQAPVSGSQDTESPPQSHGWHDPLTARKYPEAHRSHDSPVKFTGQLHSSTQVTSGSLLSAGKAVTRVKLYRTMLVAAGLSNSRRTASRLMSLRTAMISRAVAKPEVLVRIHPLSSWIRIDEVTGSKVGTLRKNAAIETPFLPMITTSYSPTGGGPSGSVSLDPRPSVTDSGWP